LPWQQIKREQAKRLAELPNRATVKFHCAEENSCDDVCGSGRSVAWLARLPWAQEVASSNLAAPTIFFFLHCCSNLFRGLFTIFTPRSWLKFYCMGKRKQENHPVKFAKNFQRAKTFENTSV
jgi:hypothetical protein